MAFRETPAFPNDIAFGATGGPIYATGVVELWGGAEQRNQQWRHPRYRYQLSLAPQTETQTRALYAFFHAVAQGQANGFRLRDFNPGESTGVDEPLGLGTGASAAYQLIKRYTAGLMHYERVISKPVPGTILLAVNGIPTTSFTVDTATGIVTVSATNGQPVTATFTFDVPVRFTSDQCAIQRIDGAFVWQQIELREVLPLPHHLLMEAFIERWEYTPTLPVTTAQMTEHWG